MYYLKLIISSVRLVSVKCFYSGYDISCSIVGILVVIATCLGITRLVEKCAQQK